MWMSTASRASSRRLTKEIQGRNRQNARKKPEKTLRRASVDQVYIFLYFADYKHFAKPLPQKCSFSCRKIWRQFLFQCIFAARFF